ncbi:hypothetical protein GTP45_08725 [Pseudoduganella sp. FT55W]|uniref:Tle cognate immunity protein 4 C-terminal domain-containing protein n=1 Tax=Duganella rivi TaxID=2666083 RepID=A0A7X4KB87_9BURK|nr:T6SS immunity protein Tli4 family protein [Duganella rivi]MYM66910.1 hypothetical protein [Duganella rivi]
MKQTILLVFILLVAGCDATKKTSEKLKMTSAMNTHCVGHSLIDLPDGYASSPGALGIFVPIQDRVTDASIDLVVEEKTNQAAFAKLVKERQVALAGVDHGNMDKLVLSQETGDGGMLFRVNEIDDAYKSEVHWLLHDRHLVARIDSYNNQVKSAEALLLEFKSNVEYMRSAKELPGAFCLGEIAVKGRYRSESASLGYRSNASKISFALDFDTFRKDDTESLLQRVGGKDSLLRKFQAKEKVLRKKELTVAGMRAQEWGASVLLGDDDSEKQASFALETMRPVPSVSAPKIHLEMNAQGSDAQDEEGLITLWDNVTKTIRMR